MAGVETKKILGMRARNKYCKLCARDSPHTTCYRNHTGSSGSMEPAILADLFEEATDSGLRYTRYIGDGDSSVENVLRTQVSYLHSMVCKICWVHQRARLTLVLSVHRLTGISDQHGSNMYFQVSYGNHITKIECKNHMLKVRYPPQVCFLETSLPTHHPGKLVSWLNTILLFASRMSRNI